MAYVIPAPTQAVAKVSGTDDVFPVRRIYCIGRNYAAHSIEMGDDPDRDPPFFFQKNPNNVDQSGTFTYPLKTDDVHYELEMVVALKSGGRDITVEDALDHVFGYAVGLDMTRRDLQAAMKKAGRPWEIGKAFEASAPMGKIIPVATVGHPIDGKVELLVNGTQQQIGDLNQMIWKVPEMIAYLSAYYDIAAGDLIMSGTPAGVGPVVKGDVMTCVIDGVDTVEIVVV